MSVQAPITRLSHVDECGSGVIRNHRSVYSDPALAKLHAQSELFAKNEQINTYFYRKPNFRYWPKAATDVFDIYTYRIAALRRRAAIHQA